MTVQRPLIIISVQKFSLKCDQFVDACLEVVIEQVE